MRIAQGVLDADAQLRPEAGVRMLMIASPRPAGSEDGE
jgi:hypothetical protein